MEYFIKFGSNYLASYYTGYCDTTSRGINNTVNQSMLIYVYSLWIELIYMESPSATTYILCTLSPFGKYIFLGAFWGSVFLNYFIYALKYMLSVSFNINIAPILTLKEIIDWVRHVYHKHMEHKWNWLFSNLK